MPSQSVQPNYAFTVPIENSNLMDDIIVQWPTIIQGSYGSWKTWKVLEFYCGIFQVWKVLEKGYWSWKVLEIC